MESMQTRERLEKIKIQQRRFEANQCNLPTVFISLRVDAGLSGHQKTNSNKNYGSSVDKQTAGNWPNGRGFAIRSGFVSMAKVCPSIGTNLLALQIRCANETTWEKRNLNKLFAFQKEQMAHQRASINRLRWSRVIRTRDKGPVTWPYQACQHFTDPTVQWF